jgi:hypothetical protein
MPTAVRSHAKINLGLGIGFFIERGIADSSSGQHR